MRNKHIKIITIIFMIYFKMILNSGRLSRIVHFATNVLLHHKLNSSTVNKFSPPMVAPCKKNNYTKNKPNISS